MKHGKQCLYVLILLFLLNGVLTAEKLILVVGDWAKEPLTPWVEKFERENNIEVEIQSFPFRDMLQTFEIRRRAKATDLDVIFVDAPLISSYAVRGLIRPMAPYISESTAKKTWVPAAIDAAKWNGEIWAPPLNNSSQLLFYNKDLLKKAALDEPSIDPGNRITWEQIVANSKVSMAANPDTWGLLFGQVSRYYQLQILPESLGGGSGINTQGNVELTNEGWLQGMQFYSDIFNKDKISPKGVTPDQTEELFASGKLAYFVNGPWSISGFEESGVNFGMALHPYFEGGKAVTPTNSWHLGLWNYSKQPDNAAKLIVYLTTNVDVAIDYTDTHGQTPAHLQAVEYVETTEKYGRYPLFGRRLATQAALDTGVTRAKTPAFLEFEEIVNNSMEDIRNGANVRSTLEEAELRIRSAMRRYR